MFRRIWDYPDLTLTPPSTLADLCKVFELQMKAVCVLATMSHYPSPIIGEAIQMLPIYPPGHEESAP